jgi:hypothetical protein
MIKIEYPLYNFRIKTSGGKELIFDSVRKQWVALTPEEWVRQNFLQYLMLVKNYSASLMAVEKEIHLGSLIKRCDIVVYTKEAKPLLIVECKAMNVDLTTEVLDQILRYNISLPVRYLIITNGSYCLGYERGANSLELLREIPAATT